MRLLPLLFLVSALQLAVPSASAVTVLSVTGVPTQCNSTGGNAGNMATGIVAAKSWTQTKGYENVNISAALDDLNTFPTPYPNFTVYLTTSAGPGTTTAQEIAHTTVMAPLVAPWTASLTTLFTGLTLPPGTYYLTVYGDPNGPALGPDCWTYSSSPTIASDSGVSNIHDLQVLGVAAYPPASSFHSLSTSMLLQVTGSTIVPPTVSKAFGATSVAVNGSTSLSFTVTNPNALTTLTAVAFTDSLPGGLIVAAPSALAGACGGGTITAIARSTTVSLAGASLAAGTSCTFSVNVTGTAVGPQNNSVTVTSNVGTGNTSNASITVVPAVSPASSLTCPAVSSAEVNVPFSSPAITVTGGTPPYTFSVAGTLPPDLTLNTTTGAITGTPTATGAFSIQATDSTGTVIGTCPFTTNLTVTSNAAFLMRYAANLNIGESYIDITNTGANGAALLGPGFGTQSGNICVNVYAFDPGEELISCCSCLVTPDQTVNLGVNRDLTVKTLTGVVPTSVTVKLLSSLAGGDGTGTSCTNSAAGVTMANLAGGLAAWGTTLHTPPGAAIYENQTTETPFTPSTLSAGELASIGGRCSSILGNGSGFGICNSCRAGALGAKPLTQ